MYLCVHKRADVQMFEDVMGNMMCVIVEATDEEYFLLVLNFHANFYLFSVVLSTEYENHAMESSGTTSYGTEMTFMIIESTQLYVTTAFAYGEGISLSYAGAWFFSTDFIHFETISNFPFTFPNFYTPCINTEE